MMKKVIFYLSFVFIFIVSAQSQLRGLNHVQNNFIAISSLTPTVIPARDSDLLPTFEGLISQTKDCTLPCWWNFEIGKTTLDEISRFLLQHKFDRHWKESIYSDIPFEDFISFEQIVLYFQDNSILGEFAMSFGFDTDNMLSGMRIRIDHPGEWLSPELDHISLSKVLNQIDETPEIYIAENPSTFRISDYNLTALFRRTGIEARYMFDLSQDNPINVPLEALRLCLDITRTETIQLSIYDTSDREPFPDFYKMPENAYGIGISTEEFVQFFREHPSECLDIEAYKESEGVTP
jgi:hypothetical protein